MSLVSARLLQLLGIAIALVGMAGYWFTQDVPRTVLSVSETKLVNPDRETFQASFVVAGRDIGYSRLAQGPIYDNRGRIVGWRQPAQGSVEGTNTDTILYVNVVGERVYIVAIPRDVYLEPYRTKINAMYYYGGDRGGDYLRQAVSELLNVSIDYYLILNIDIFERLVDVIGGVEMYIPYDMYYIDHAAGLTIDFKQGSRHLNGQEAGEFVRYRQTLLGDYDRIDNIKALADAMLAQLKRQHIRLIGVLPELYDTLIDEVESNIGPALVGELLPRANRLDIRAVTLPTQEVPGTSNLYVDPRATERFLAELFGGEARMVSEVPETPLLITNRSGVAGLAEQVKRQLVVMGIAEELLLVRDANPDPMPTRVLSTTPRWQDANYYAQLFRVGQQQVARQDLPAAQRTGLELVLGQDAALMMIGQTNTDPLNQFVEGGEHHNQ